MSRRMVAVWLVLSLAGCVGSAPYGNFVDGTVTPTMHARLAQDTVTKLLDLYPPATTRLVFRHSATDAYGTVLTERLRQQGYALTEYRYNPTWYTPAPTRADAPVVEQPEVREGTGVPLRYVVDGPWDGRLYRVTVFVGLYTLSRVYSVEQQRMADAGAWAKGESRE